MASEALALEGIDAFYGDSHVLHGVSLRLGEGRLLGLLGRNGAGKSTTLHVTVGLLPPRGGAVTVYGSPVTGRPPEAIAARGIALVPQGRRIFRSLTVRENLAVAGRRRRGRPMQWTLDSVSALFPRLRERARQMAGSLSGGEQQMLAIGRALMSNPRVLLMDEPSEGLAPQIIAEVMTTIRRLKAEGLSIVLVEQNAKLVLDVADDLVVLNSGRVVVDDTVAGLAGDGVDLGRHLGIY
ncbi:MAG TPA: ABC transporter ATP-binding protein [Candidatus Methylomirabilis sp.]|nr:ABC transporter ATP-binding protein [Candidatus Methylomirabilis sp.]